MSSPGSRLPGKRTLIAAGTAVTVLVAVALFAILHSPANVSHPNLSFTPPAGLPSTASPKKQVQAPFLWPRYGYDAARSRAFDPGSTLAPPLRVGWRFNDGALLEFPPVIYGNSLFVLDDNGFARSISTLTGHVLWTHRLGTLAAASPAVDSHLHLVVFVLLSTVPNAGQNPGNGRAVAVSMTTGKVRWSHALPKGSESSPSVWNASVYFGDQGGTVYSLQARSGHVNWTYHATGAVKGGVSVAGSNLYLADYAGRVYALNTRTGRQVWAVGTTGTAFGFGSGNFYSTPAVAFGRVYLGNTDGRVYSFAERTGQLAWATSTGAYVYASPAVADVRGVGPTVYLGSYDGSFYAFNAQSGTIRWSHPSGGKISGAATIIGSVVYYSDLGSRSTTGLDARSGHTVFKFPDGAFNAVIADDNAIFLDGYGEMYQLLPTRGAPAARGPARPSRR